MKVPVIALEPCPFCGNGNVKVHEKRRGNYRREGDNYQVWCTRCKGRGPLVQDSPAGAAYSWNARAASVGRNPQGGDRNGLRAQHEHAVGEAETPNLPPLSPKGSPNE